MAGRKLDLLPRPSWISGGCCEGGEESLRSSVGEG